MELPGGDVVLQLAGLVGAVIFLSTVAIKFYRFIDHTEDAWRKLTALVDETKPNGGNSLRDVLDQTRGDVTNLVTQVDMIKTNVGRLQDGQQRLDARVEAVTGWQLAQSVHQEAITRHLTARDPMARTRQSDLPEDPQDYV